VGRVAGGSPFDGLEAGVGAAAEVVEGSAGRLPPHVWEAGLVSSGEWAALRQWVDTSLTRSPSCRRKKCMDLKGTIIEQSQRQLGAIPAYDDETGQEEL
jgi:hypothetical protein